MASIPAILMIVALVFLGIAAFWSPQPPAPSKIHFGWLGMFTWALSIVLGGFKL